MGSVLWVSALDLEFLVRSLAGVVACFLGHDKQTIKQTIACLELFVCLFDFPPSGYR